MTPGPSPPDGTSTTRTVRGARGVHGRRRPATTGAAGTEAVSASTAPTPPNGAELSAAGSPAAAVSSPVPAALAASPPSAPTAVAPPDLGVAPVVVASGSRPPRQSRTWSFRTRSPRRSCPGRLQLGRVPTSSGTRSARRRVRWPPGSLLMRPSPECSWRSLPCGGTPVPRCTTTRRPARPRVGRCPRRGRRRALQVIAPAPAHA